jgi:hypothetical protein
MLETLKIDHEDSIDLLYLLEDSFACRFSDEEVSEWRTVGDIEDAVSSRVHEGPWLGRKCLTSMAFYRLRRVLRGQDGRRSIASTTCVLDATTRSPEEVRRALSSSAGLSTPSFAGADRLIGASMAVACLFLTLVGLSLLSAAWLIIGLAGLALACGMAICDRGAFPPELTVGELARTIADRNVARLASAGGRADKRAVLAALRRHLAAHAPNEGDFDRSTRLVA